MKNKNRTLSESRRLKIVEQKVNIQMKRVEMKNEKIAIEVNDPRRISVDEQGILIHKISELRCLLSDSTINEEKTIFGSEPVYKSILDEEERQLVKTKLRELIKKF